MKRKKGHRALLIINIKQKKNKEYIFERKKKTMEHFFKIAIHE